MAKKFWPFDFPVLLAFDGQNFFEKNSGFKHPKLLQILPKTLPKILTKIKFETPVENNRKCRNFRKSPKILVETCYFRDMTVYTQRPSYTTMSGNNRRLAKKPKLKKSRCDKIPKIVKKKKVAYL